MKRGWTLALALTVSLLGYNEAAAAADPIQKAVDLIMQASGGQATLTRAPNTGVVTFMSVPAGNEIPAAGANARLRATAFITGYGAAFGLSSASYLEATQDDLGMYHVRFRQTQNGVPVAAGELTIHLRDAGVAAVSARTAAKVGEVDPTPSVTSDKAVNFAAALVRKQYGLSTVSTVTPTLQVFVPSLWGATGRSPVLAWFVEVYTEDVREFVWIDARRGVALLHFSQLPEALSRQVSDAGATSSLPGSLARGEGDPDTADADVDHAYQYAGDFYNYLSSAFGRDSLDGSGAALASSVDYCPAGGCPYANAFWNGRTRRAVFGPGMPAADDIVAHEFTHGLIDSTARLYNYKEPGALAESFADLFGELVDLENGADGTPWEIGEGSGGALRSMINPAAYGQPAWSGDSTYYCGAEGDGGSHTNSGVLNHAFAMMAVGGSYRSISVSPMSSRAVLGQIAYRALTRYLTSGSTFIDADRALRQACDDLVGSVGVTSADCDTVGAALDAVDLQTPPAACAAVAPAPFCGAGLGPLDTFYDGFETRGTNVWTAGATVGANAWTVGTGTPAVYATGYADSGTYSLWGLAPAAASDSAVATAKAIVVPDGGMLSIRHSYAFEADRDGGVVEYMGSGGTWEDAEPLRVSGADYGTNPLPATWGNPLAGRRAFTGLSGGYVSTQYDFSSLAGQSVRIRFRVGSDQGTAYEGWHVDEVRIYSCDVGGTFQLSADAVRVAETTAAVTLSVKRPLTDGAAGGVVVRYATDDGTGTALPGQDYVSTSGLLTFGSRVASQSFTVKIINDTEDDDEESFNVNVSVVSGPTATIGTPASTQITITNNDVAGKVSFEQTTYSGNEATGYVDLWLVRGGTSSNATVAYHTVDGTARAIDGDYVEVLGGTVMFAAGQTRQRIRIQLLDDCIVEPTEAFSVVIDSPGGGAELGGRTTATVNLINNDRAGSVAFAPVSYTALEAVDSGGTPVPGSVTVSVARADGAACETTVDYATADGSAIGGVDYQVTSGTLTFGRGERTKTVVIPFIDDALPEGNETFGVVLSNPGGGAKLGTSTQAKITIADDEKGVQFAREFYSVDENDGQVVVAVKRTGPQVGTIVVQYEVADQTARAGTDYLITTNPGTITFGAATTSLSIPIRIRDDNGVVQKSRDFTVRLVSATGGLVGALSTTAVRIYENDDGGVIDFARAAFAVPEVEGTVNIPVIRGRGTAGGVTVDYFTYDYSPVEAVAGVDYEEAHGTVTFAAGQTTTNIPIQFHQDNDVEGQEQFWLELRDPVGAVTNGRVHARIVVQDNWEDVITFLNKRPWNYESIGANFIVMRLGGNTMSTVKVDYRTDDGTALKGTDYMKTVGTLTFGPGVMSQTVQIQFIDDAVPEDDKEFYFRLQNVRTDDGKVFNLTSDPFATVVIKDDDWGSKTGLAADAFAGTEGGVAKIIISSLGNASPQTRTKVLVDITPGTAVPCASPCSAKDGDYIWDGPKTVALEATQKQVVISVPLIGDGLVEGLETAHITLSAATPNMNTTLTDATLYIKDADAPSFRFVDNTGADEPLYRVKENVSGLSIRVSRSGSTTSEATIEYDVAPAAVNGASSPQDFVAAHGVLTFAAGQSTQSFVVLLANDDIREDAKYIQLTLSNPSAGYVLGYPSSSAVEIADDDPVCVVEFGQPAFAGPEGGSAAVTIVRSNKVSGSVTVHWATVAGGTATPDVDYTQSSGTVSFAAGESTKTVYVPLAANGTVEPEARWIQLELDTAGGGATLENARVRTMVWIVDMN